MARIYIHDSHPRFIFLLNYKAMSTTVGTLLMQQFPDLQMKYPTTMRLSLDQRLSYKINFQVLYSTIDRVLYKFPRLYRHKALLNGVHKETLAEVDLNTYEKYAIVRNPFSRTVSVFFDKCRKHPEKVWHGERDLMLQRSHSEILKAFNTWKGVMHPLAPVDINCEGHPQYDAICRENLTRLQNLSFDDFTKLLVIILRSANADRHFTPQCNLLRRQDKLIVDDIYKMEEIDAHWPLLCKKLGKSIALQQRNPSKHRHYSEYYNSESKKIIEDLYVVDLNEFDYDLSDR